MPKPPFQNPEDRPIHGPLSLELATSVLTPHSQMLSLIPDASGPESDDEDESSVEESADRQQLE